MKQTKEERELKFIAYWEKEQAGGFLKFCFYNGMGFAVMFFILSMIFDIIRNGWSAINLRGVLIALILNILLGFVFYGPVTWFMNKNIYKNYKAKRS